MIHKFTQNGTNIAVDVYSGAVHVLDDTAYEVLNYFENLDHESIIERLSDKYSSGEIVEALNELEYLKEQGLLFSENPYEEFNINKEQKPVVKALCLHAAHDCNLRCEYCFASTGDFGHSRGLMPLETAKKTIDFLLANSGARKNLEVDFFGGEPLMNFEVVKETVRYGREREKELGKNIRFTLTTNGMLLNEEVMEFVNENMSNLVLSIDGRQEVNDRVRCRIDGTGTYNHILPRIKAAADSRNQEKYYVRGTFTRHNLDFAEDVLHLADLGFKQVSVEPVVASADKNYALRNEDVETVCKEYEKLAAEFINRYKNGKGFNFFHFQLELDEGPCISKRLKGCGAGDEYLAVTPEGEIYPCHQFVGNEKFLIGNVNDGILKEEIREVFKGSNIFTKEKCKECWCKFYCSGGCAANAWMYNKDVNIPYELGCELQKKRVECALVVKAALL
ncbi:MAG: thioether cross-link-forming SCIFF peptide maturase [Ignavibacteriales bacterium]